MQVQQQQHQPSKHTWTKRQMMLLVLVVVSLLWHKYIRPLLYTIPLRRVFTVNMVCRSIQRDPNSFEREQELLFLLGQKNTLRYWRKEELFRDLVITYFQGSILQNYFTHDNYSGELDPDIANIHRQVPTLINCTNQECIMIATILTRTSNRRTSKPKTLPKDEA